MMKTGIFHGNTMAEISPSNMAGMLNYRSLMSVSNPMDPSTFLGSVWGITYYNLEA